MALVLAVGSPGGSRIIAYVGQALVAMLNWRLAARGHEVRVRPLNSGLHAVAVTGSGLEGGADPRREGVALGD